MPYTTYGRDMQRAWNGFSKPAKAWMKSLVKIHDPFKLIEPTTKFIVHGFIFAGKLLFFTMRKAVNR